MPIKFTGYTDNQGWHRPKYAFCSTSHSKDVQTCSQTRLPKALKIFQDQGRHHFTDLSWSTKAFSPSLVFSSFCHELLWSAWLHLLSSPFHQCHNRHQVPLFSCPSSQLNSPRNHSFSSKGKGPSPIISTISAEFSPHSHYVSLIITMSYRDPELDVLIGDLRSAEHRWTNLILTELLHTP